MSNRSQSTSAANARRAIRIATLATAAAAAAAGSPALAAPGDLDPTFGKGGRVIVDIENDNDAPVGMHLQPDGKIIVGRSNTASNDDFSVLRFNPDGSPDTSFGTDGRTSLDIPETKGTTQALLRQPDGKIVVAGETLASASQATPRLGLVRYLENGSPDPTFGIGGVAIQSDDVRYGLTSMALQPDGRLLVAGNLRRTDRQEIVVARFEPDGSLDRSFGEDGYAFGNGNTWEYGGQLSLQSDGTFLVFASVESDMPEGWYDWSPAIMRFYADGSPDTAFGDNGRALILSEAEFRAVVTQSDGRMLLAAANDPYWWDIFYCGAVLTRVHPDGQRDDSFGIGGMKEVSFSGCATPGGAMLIDPTGNIVVDSAQSTNDVLDWTIDSRDYVVTRLDSSGEMDPSFGVGGQAVLDVGDGRNLPYAIAGGNLLRQDDGKLVILTSGIRALVSWGDNDRMVLARLQASGGSPGLIGIKAVDPKRRASDGRIPMLVRRSGGSQGIVSVDYSTAGGPDSQGFVPVYGTLVWGDGDRADKLLVIEPPGGFTFLLANATGGAELAMSEIQVGTETEPAINTTQPGTPQPSTLNGGTGGGGGALSWEVLMLLALGVLRRAWSSRSSRPAAVRFAGASCPPTVHAAAAREPRWCAAVPARSAVKSPTPSMVLAFRGSRFRRKRDFDCKTFARADHG
jgi:uncharacterized delta-60 repeat protein